jgi:hypothetical protein
MLDDAADVPGWRVCDAVMHRLRVLGQTGAGEAEMQRVVDGVLGASAGGRDDDRRTLSFCSAAASRRSSRRSSARCT